MKSKALIIAGSSGSGKSTFLKQNLNEKNFVIINPDDAFEEMLKQHNISLQQTHWTPKELSKAGQLQAQAVKHSKEKLSTALEQKQNIILDTTAGSLKKIKEKKEFLEQNGYEVIMIMLHVYPLVSLTRNFLRGQQDGRELKPSIILNSWVNTNKNISNYKELFGDNFILLDNNPAQTKALFSKEDVKPFISQDKATGKPKTEKELQKAKEKKEKLYNEIMELVKNTPVFDDVSKMREKLSLFFSK